ncbi:MULTISPECIES: DUF6270 domain-containing protein [Corynebacterium]|uniref:DUF6270 domain-containing protein n=1 Tax=Corynebacterium TaxID=1716 RepID=UPI002110CA4E|nr:MULTISPECIES: DUF6270 domain-containing protein [Corynebacterium]MCT1564267.1 DUF6270 domain-containing protein [Corynebacterium glucuronolyticum]
MKKVVIYGSCVSRDCFNRPQNEFEVSAYFARNSWISSCNEPVPVPKAKSLLESAFQQRMVERDFRSTTLPQLEKLTPDIMLLDLIDERAGIIPVKSGGYITYLSELKHSGWLENVDHGKLIPLGSDRHFELFKQAATRLSSVLKTKNPVLLKPSFANETIQGESVRPLMGKTAEQWDHLYERYYAEAAAAGFQVCEIPHQFCRSANDHRWGVAPYHYEARFYDYVLQQLSQYP